MRQTSPTSSRRDENGFALFDLLLALAVLALVAAVALPRMIRPPGETELGAKANEIAALYRADRNAAIRSRHQVVTLADIGARRIRSGAGGPPVTIPKTIAVEAIQAGRETAGDTGGIRFYPDGRSSGGGITLRRHGIAYEVNVNWLTAGVLVSRRDGAAATP
jgi:general secretion pathway protein H